MLLTWCSYKSNQVKLGLETWSPSQIDNSCIVKLTNYAPVSRVRCLKLMRNTLLCQRVPRKGWKVERLTASNKKEPIKYDTHYWVAVVVLFYFLILLTLSVTQFFQSILTFRSIKLFLEISFTFNKSWKCLNIPGWMLKL